MSDIRLGCSGWDYKDWVSTFYKRNESSKLKAYTTIFNTAEINSTFYSYPNPGLVLGWNTHTPDDFLFSVKLNREITHKKRLDISAGVEDDVYRFCELIEPLNKSGKLACILIQLPPSLKFSKDRIDAFLGVLPDKYTFALEFRNISWLIEDAYNLFGKYNIIPVMTDSPALPKQVMSSANLAYIRWHGRGSRIWYNYHYSETELESWTTTIKELSDIVDVLGYFNNHYHGYAPENCLDVLEMLGVSVPKQKSMRQHLKADVPKNTTRDTTLTEFFIADNVPGEIEKLLLEFTDKGRFERGILIKDVNIIKQDPDLIIADVRGYSIYIDYNRKFILHDCQDWKRSMSRQRLCKHVVALISSLPQEQSRTLLHLIKEQRWDFRPYTG